MFWIADALMKRKLFSVHNSRTDQGALPYRDHGIDQPYYLRFGVEGFLPKKKI
jgi:hypothetical protein